MMLLRQLRHRVRRRQLEAEMAEEMRFHLEERAAELTAGGLPAAEARFAAQRRFGNLCRIQEQAREVRGWGWLDRLGGDLRLGARQLARTPGFTALAVVTLALGIGANTSMFSVLNATLLRPLPYPEAGALERIERFAADSTTGRVSPADWLDLAPELPRYGAVAAYQIVDLVLAAPDQPPEMVLALRATPDLLPLLGVAPQLGRNFRADEASPGRDRVALLSDRAWRRHFGARRDLIGQTVRLGGDPVTVIGVLPPSFNDWRHLGAMDVVRPLALDAVAAADRQNTSIRLLGRRAEGRSRAEADAIIAQLGERLAAAHPDVHAGAGWRTVPLLHRVADPSAHRMMLMLLGLSGFVLLIACSNLANLLLARTMARARELAIRSALGASRVQLLRPLLAESVLLAIAGGAVAVLLALWVGDYLAFRSTGDNGERVIFSLDGRVLGWALAASCTTMGVFGLAPAVFALRLDLSAALKSGGRGLAGAAGHQRFRHALLIGQFALALVLLAGAGLFYGGLEELSGRRTEWPCDHLVTGSIVLPAATYPDSASIHAFQRRALEELQALPGVAAAGFSSASPFFEWPEMRRVVAERRGQPAVGPGRVVAVNRVSPAYFDTVGTRLLAGRSFAAGDSEDAPHVCVVSQSLAAALFGREDPLGRRIALAGGGKEGRSVIVGVAADVRPITADLVTAVHQLYLPLAQAPANRVEICVRTEPGTSAGMPDLIRAAMTGVDPDLPVRDLRSADQAIDRANYQLRVLRDILAALAALGLGLALLGIYGVIARAIGHRTAEFAVRIALGARERDITRLVLRAGARLALMGIGLGLGGAWIVARLIAAGFPGMRFDLTPVLLVITALLVGVALLACWLPARRAGRIDAMAILRAE